jgi:cytochrome c oxidase subunit 2
VTPRRRAGPLAATTLVLVIGTACSNTAPSILRAHSSDSRKVESLWWLTLVVSVIVVLFVIAFILAAVRRGWSTPPDAPVDKSPVRWGPSFIVIAGLVVSGGILGTIFGISLKTLDALASSPKPVVSIDVIGHDWWWEARYPNGVVTANEIHIPAGQPVEVKLSTTDVIHSFWVPELNVKKDQIPGQDNRLSLLADRPGRYRGQCAEFCGLEHARMAFFVDADPPAQFDQWLAAQAVPARDPSTPSASTGRDVFLRSSCAGCHTVRGTAAAGTFGPDLTHVASRATIGAGVLPFTPGSLGDFILDAQHAKPGASMPPTEISPQELSAVVDYLTGLQ